MNGIINNVTETSQEISIESVQLDTSTGRHVAKAKPRPKLVVNSTSHSVPISERRWMDIAQPFDHSCFEVSKFMTRTLRHEASIPREIDGAVNFDDSLEKLKVKFADALQWPVSTWVDLSGKRRRKEEEVSILFESFFFQ